MFCKRRNCGRHILNENKQRKPLKRKDILLRLKELHEILDPKKCVQLTADDVEIIDYNFALAQLYDRICAGSDGGFAVGFETESERDCEDYEDEGETVGGVTLCRGGGLEYVPKAKKPRRRKEGRA